MRKTLNQKIRRLEKDFDEEKLFKRVEMWFLYLTELTVDTNKEVQKSVLGTCVSTWDIFSWAAKRVRTLSLRLGSWRGSYIHPVLFFPDTTDFPSTSNSWSSSCAFFPSSLTTTCCCCPTPVTTTCSPDSGFPGPGFVLCCPGFASSSWTKAGLSLPVPGAEINI